MEVVKAALPAQNPRVIRNKLLSMLENAALTKAASGKGFTCPACGSNLQAKGVVSGQVLTCPSCGHFGSATEWLMKSGTDHSGSTPLPANIKPAGTRITLEPRMGATVWKIPASGRSGGLVPFAWLWSLFCLAMGGMVLWSGITGTVTINDQPATVERALGMELFMTPFFLIGAAMLYFGYRSKLASHEVSIGRGRVALTRHWLGRAKEKSITLADVETIGQAVFYTRNYQPVHGIEIKGGRKKLRFGSSLTEAEKAWLVEQFQRSVWPDRFRVEETSPQHSAAAPATTVAGNSAFSVLLPKPSSLIGLSLMLLIMGAAFLAVGIFLIKPVGGGSSGHAPGIFRVLELLFSVLDSGFRIVWCLFSTIMLVAGTFCLRSHRRNAGVEQRLVGSPTSISLKRLRHGTVIEERTFERSRFRDIRATVSGSVNGRPMKRIELILGDRSETIANWVAGEKADALVEEVRQAMR